MIWEISGYWKDDGETFSGLLVTDNDGCDDDDIFYYVNGEHNLKEMVIDGIHTCEDFVVTSYNKQGELHETE